MSTRATAPLSAAEARATCIAAGATAWFALYGVATHAPSTTGYIASVVAIGLAIRSLRRDPLPSSLAYALAVAAIVHLAGGIVAVGRDGLYNASIGPSVGVLHTHLLQYDHFAHAFASGVGMLTLWHLLVPEPTTELARRPALLLCALAGFGIGAINETVEFITTIAHQGAHVGGYTNTGWDLVANTIGVAIAASLIARRPARVEVTV